MTKRWPISHYKKRGTTQVGAGRRKLKVDFEVEAFKGRRKELK